MSKGMRLAIVVTAVIVAFVVGSAVRELTTYKEAGVGAAIGLPAIVALFGMFWVADHWKDALTAAFAVTYFIFLAGILAIFVFPQANFTLEGGAKVVVDNFTGLMAVVVAAYFGQEAIRAAAQAYSNGRVFGPGGAGTVATAAGPAADSPSSPVAPVQIDTN